MRLVDIKIIPKDDQIRASNLYSLFAAVEQINMDPVNLGIHKDEQGSNKAKYRIRSSI